jgi:hypothetical protein
VVNFDDAVDNLDFVLSVDVVSFFDDGGRSSSGITVVGELVVSVS